MILNILNNKLLFQFIVNIENNSIMKKYQIKTVEKFIKCGDPQYGFAYVECPNCGESYFVPFSP